MRNHLSMLVLGVAIALAIPASSALAQNYAITGSSRVITKDEVESGSSGVIELDPNGGYVSASSSYTGAGSTYADRGEAVTLTISQIAGPSGQKGYSQFALIASGNVSGNGMDGATGNDWAKWAYPTYLSNQMGPVFSINTVYPSSTTWYQNFSAPTTL